MPLSHTIRAAGVHDALGIFELIRGNPEALIGRPLGDITENIDRFVVAEADGRLVGCAAWNILPEAGDPMRASLEIRSVAVMKNWCGQGVGTELVEAIFRGAAGLGIRQAIVLTFAPGFFKHLGFCEVPKTTIMHKIYMGCMNCTRQADPFTCPEVAMIRPLAGAGNNSCQHHEAAQ